MRDSAKTILGLSDQITEMAILDRVELGFNFCAYVSPEQGGHGPRVKFAQTRKELKTKSFSVSIDADPELLIGKPPSQEILNSAVAWVKANHVILTMFWHDPTSLTTRDLIAALKPV